MEEQTLVFDDWAMYLMENWVEAYDACESRKQIYIDGDMNFEDEVEQSLNEAHAQLYSLVDYLKTALEYNALSLRRGYAQYITLDAVHLDALLTLISYMYEGEPEGYRSFVRNRSKRKMLENCLLLQLKKLR